MVLLGFMVNYMLRVNFSIAIVDMVSNHEKNVSTGPTANFSTLTLNDTNVSVSGIIYIIINYCNDTILFCLLDFYVFLEKLY